MREGTINRERESRERAERAKEETGDRREEESEREKRQTETQETQRKTGELTLNAASFRVTRPCGINIGSLSPRMNGRLQQRLCITAFINMLYPYASITSAYMREKVMHTSRLIRKGNTRREKKTHKHKKKRL